MAHNPVFIHSLFRAGSTYLFSRLRNSPELYCFYESMHELVAWASEDVTRLDIESRAEKMQQLNHPVLDKPYFEELKAVWPAWEKALAPETVYGGYFAEAPDAAGAGFFSALSAASPRQPLFSECRTAGRIPALKRGVGGHHVYLWRNPWDQWWSYQVDPYFDAASRVIGHADPLPEPLRAVKAEFAIAVAPVSTFSEARDFYDLRPLDFEASYAWFYGLWLYLLDLAGAHADLLISIDSLGRSAAHTETVTSVLSAWGISDLDFSDACSPVSQFTALEAEAFARVEARVHALFQGAGWDASRISAIDRLRDGHRADNAADAQAAALAASYRRSLLAVRAQGVARAGKWAGLYDWQAETLEESRRDIVALHRALEHDRKVVAELKRSQEALAREGERDAAELALAQMYIDQLTGSVSWRLTAPLRTLVDTVFTPLKKIVERTPGSDSLGLRLVDGLARFPLLMRVANAMLRRAPALRRWLTTVLGVPGVAELPRLDTDPGQLSPRGVALFNQLAKELEMPELSSAVAADDRDLT